MQDTWTESLVLLFMLSSAVACASAFFHGLVHLGEAKTVLTKTVLGITGAVVITQTVLSWAAIEFSRTGSVPPVTSDIIVFNWALVIIAVAALPGALLLVRDSPANVLPPEFPSRLVFASAIAVLVISWGFQGLILLFSDVFVVSPDLEALLENDRAKWLFLGLAIIAVFTEELIFRGALQGLLERLMGNFGNGWPPIVVTSLFWAAGHSGMIEPDGFKEAQIFAVGLILGRLRQRAGLGAAVLVHLILNLSAVLGELVLTRFM